MTCDDGFFYKFPAEAAKLTERFLIIGGTGSIGHALTRRLIADGRVIGIFSRDEAKHHRHKETFNNKFIKYHIGDVRDIDSIRRAIRLFNPTVIVMAAALKQVPVCEEQPEEAVKTNVLGTQNVLMAATEHTGRSPGCYLKVLSISTDKAVSPLNAYGCTKALQEKIHTNFNNGWQLIANCVRYGNVLESTGSVIPVFQNKLSQGQKIQLTDKRMTRFLLSLDDAVNLISRALNDLLGARIFIPQIKSAKIVHLAEVLCEHYGYDPKEMIEITNIRPGEKLHEILVSEGECHRTVFENNSYTILPANEGVDLPGEGYSEYSFSSGNPKNLLSKQQLRKLLIEKGVLCESESQAKTAS